MKSPSSLPLFLLSCSFVRLGGSFRTPRLIRISSPVQTKSASADAATFVGIVKRVAAITAMSVSTTATTTRSNENFSIPATTAWEDAKAYNTYASAAVDLSNAHVSEAGLLTGECTNNDIVRDYLLARKTPPNPDLVIPSIACQQNSDSNSTRHRPCGAS